jgi:hypothetical protein
MPQPPKTSSQRLGTMIAATRCTGWDDANNIAAYSGSIRAWNSAMPTNHAEDVYDDPAQPNHRCHRRVRGGYSRSWPSSRPEAASTQTH